VAENGVASDGCDGREEAPVLRKLPMPDCIHAAMNRVKPNDEDPITHGRRRDAERAELPRGDDPVLPIREGREANIRRCLTLRAIIDGNVKHPARVT